MARALDAVRRISSGVGGALILSLVLAAVPAGQAQTQGQAAPKPAKKDPAAKLEQPWPDAAQLADRRTAAEALPLFASADPLPITLSASFTDINRDRTPESTKRFAGSLQLPGAGGAKATVPVQIGSRGHARLDSRTCSIVPLRLEMEKKDVKATVLNGQRELKLVTHCENDRTYEQNILVEYLAYRIFNTLTPRSFRARLVQATYVDTARNKANGPRVGMLLEQDDDVAKRMDGRTVSLTNRMFHMLDRETLLTMSLLQYLAGNTDFSILKLHNIKLVQDKPGALFPIAYDFDYSGLVNARYAVPDRALMIKSVRTRVYRGPCLQVQELEPFAVKFRAKKAEILALTDTVPGLDKDRRQDVRDYLEEGLDIITTPGRAKRMIIDGCTRVAGM